MFEFTGRLVVLGGSGFVGSNVVKKARLEGWEVLSLSSRDVNLNADNTASSLAGYVNDGDSFVNAAAVAPTRNAGDLVSNIQMSQNLVEALSGREIAQMVVVSSDAVYGSASDIATESSLCNPDSFHGIMSLTREMICSEVRSSVHTVVRPTAIYGAGDTHNSYGPNRFVRQVLESGEITVFGAGEAVRDHVAVEDVAELVVRAVAGKEGGVINAACGRSISFAALAELVRLAGPEGTRIVVSGSESTPTFRNYDISNLARRFPGLRMRGVEEGLIAMLNQVARAKGAHEAG